jgi:hypothetical protein
MFQKLLRSFARSAGNSKRKPTARRILALERLEERQLLSAVPTLTTLSASASTVALGQSVTLTATVAVVSPNTGTPSGGTVTFLNGTTSLGTAALASGKATLQVSALPLGADVLLADYSGDGVNFAASSTVIGPNSIITTYAGNGTDGYSNGIAATAAQLSGPDGVAVDAAGDLFIADNANNVIREVNHTTGVITTVAGDGTQGYSGDGSKATAAELFGPVDVAVDTAGDLFIADSWNNRIREVNHTTGVITTVAGSSGWGDSGDNGPATAAELSGPTGVAVDAAGDLFVADTDNIRIREVNHVTGVITTVAGDGTQGESGDHGQATTAELGFPEGVAVDGAGHLFIADTGAAQYSGGQRIREVNLASGVITTVAGNGTAGYSGDNGKATAAELCNPQSVAVDSVGDLFIADQSNQRIREVNHTTGVITTVAGNGSEGVAGDYAHATAAELYNPAGVAVDAAGNIFIADTGNDHIREVNHATGIITTVAGGGVNSSIGDNGPATAAELGDPNAVAVDAAGDLFIADYSNDRVREVNHATGVITTVAGNGTQGYSGDGYQATAAELAFPSGVALDSNGDIFIADSENDRIREVNHATGVITTVAGNGTWGYGGDNGPATTAELKGPTGVAVDATGDLFIADNQNNRIREVAGGVITTVAGNGTQGYLGNNGQATAAELELPQSVALDSAGDLFIAEPGQSWILEVNRSTGVIALVAGNVNSPAGDGGDNGPATEAGLDAPMSVAVDSAGDFFIADTYNNLIREVNYATGVITTVAGNVTYGYSGDNGSASAAALANPFGVAVDAAGDLFIADSGNNRIREVASGGAEVMVTVPVPTFTLTGPSAGTFSAGQSVTIGWTATNVDVAGPSKITLGYDPDTTPFDANQRWLEVDRVTAANGAGSYSWNTTGVAAGTYYVSGYVYDFSTDQAVYSSLATSIVITGGAPPAFTLTGPSAGTFTAGQSVTIGWTATNVDVAGPTKITLGYDPDAAPFDTNQRWIEIDGVTAANGAGSYTWNTTGMAAGTYYLSGYIYDFAVGSAMYSHLGTSIVITPPPAPTFTLTGPSAGTFSAGQSVTIQWTATNVDVAGPAKISLGYDRDATAFDANQHWLEVDGVTAANGAGSYTWNTTGMAAGTYYLDGYMYDFSTDKAVYSHLGASIVSTGNASLTTTVLAVSANAVNVGQSVTLTATVTAVAPSTATPSGGTVSFTDGSTVLGTAPMSGGVATFVAPSLAAGYHLLSASYSGDGANFFGSNASIGPGAVITTVAGGEDYNGDGIPASLAELNQPSAVTFDAAGDLFIADRGNYRVREVNHATGAITTVAGNGSFGFAGDGGPATAAEFDGLAGLAVDSHGDLFIADEYNNRVREVNLATGIVTTVAGSGGQNYPVEFAGGDGGDGGPATAAQLGAPTGVAIDNHGDLFIADSWGGVIREVNMATGVISTVAGNRTSGNVGIGDGGPATAAELGLPNGVAVDAAGQLFIVDYLDDRIREVNLSTGVITTVAGNGTAGDGGPATAAELDGPAGIALDASGDIFIADDGNQRVREVNHLSGVITTVAGNDTAGYGGDGGQATASEVNGPAGLAVNAGGNLFIADSGNNRIRTVNMATRVITTIAGCAPSASGPASATALADPTAVAADGNGHLFISEGNEIREVDLATNQITTIAGNATAGFSGDGGPATAAEFDAPTGLALDGNGDLFIADAGNQRIREINLASGVINTIAGNGTAAYSGDGGAATAAELCAPQGVAVDSAGHLFIADSGDDRIREVNLSSGLISTVAGNGSFPEWWDTLGNGGQATNAYVVQPCSVAVDNKGHLYIADVGYENSVGAEEVRVVDLSTGVINSVTSASTDFITGIATDGNGNLFLSHAVDTPAFVMEVNLATRAVTYFAGKDPGYFGSPNYNGDEIPAVNAMLESPVAIALDPNGNLFIADSGTDRIREISPAVPVYVSPTPLKLTITAGNYSKTYGSPDPFPNSSDLDTLSCTGFVEGESPADLGGTLQLTTNEPATGNAPVGSYQITPSGLTSSSYAITFVGGTLTVTPATSSTSVTTSTLIYGAPHDTLTAAVTDPTAAANEGTVTFVVQDSQGHTVTLSTASATVSNGVAALGWSPPAAGTYTVTASYTDGSGNFSGSSTTAAATVTVTPAPTFTLTGPSAGTFTAGANVTIGWTAANVDVAGPTKISLGYDPDSTAFDANQHWIEVDRVTAANGAGSYSWNTTGVASGTYYLSGYMYDFSTDQAVYSSLATSIIITGGAPPAFTLTGPSAGTFSAGQSVTIGWTATNVDVAGPTKITLGYDPDATAFDANQHWLEIDGVTAANGAGSYTWNTTGMAVGTYYLDGYMYDFSTDKAVYSHLGAPIVSTGNASLTTTVLAVSANAVNVGQSVTLTATVTAVAPSTATPSGGTVSFMDGSAVLGTAPLSGGVATFVAPSLATGYHLLSASYSGDGANFFGSNASIGPGAVITTVAGGEDYNGDGIPASLAELNQPSAVTFDAAGDLFIADTGNYRVREVNHATGAITTVAGNGSFGFAGDGGPATAAEFDGIAGLAVDSHGDLFIADEYNNRVREVNLATGIVTTVAGNGGQNYPWPPEPPGGYGGDGGPATAAQLGAPMGIAVDAKGNLFIADTENGRIREVNLATGVITTVAGNGTYGNAGIGDGGPATAAELGAEGIAVDAKGNLFIADKNNDRIRAVNLSTGVITTVAGNGTAGDSGDGGPATAAGLDSPEGIALDASGDIFIDDAGYQGVREVNHFTGVITIVAGNDTTGYSGDGGAATVAELNEPVGLAVNTGGNLFIADSGNNRIRTVNMATRVITTIAGCAPSASGPASETFLADPTVVAADAAGHLFISDGNEIREVDLATNYITTIAGNATAGFAGDGGPATAAEFDGIAGLAVDNRGNLFIADEYNNRVREVNLAAGTVTTVAGNGTAAYSGDGGAATAAELAYPESVAVDAAGDLFIADSGNNRIREVNLSTGAISTVAGKSWILSQWGSWGDGGQATAAELYEPNDVAVDNNGHLFIDDLGDQGIREVDLSTGVINSVPGVRAYRISGVAADAAGHLFVSSTYGLPMYVEEVNLSTGAVTDYAGADSSGATDYNGDNILAVNAMLGYPTGIALDPNGNLFIADSDTDRVREISPTVPVYVSPTPLKLTVTAPNFGKTYGSPDPFASSWDPYSLSFSGFVEGENSASLGGTLQLTTNEPATGNAPVGSYQITPSGLTSSSYAITFVSGTLTVTPATSSTSVTTTALIYGAPRDTLTAAVTSPTATANEGTVTFVVQDSQGHTVTLSTASATVSNGVAALGWSPPTAGTYTVTASYTDGSGNFSGSSTTAAATVTVTPAPTFTLTGPSAGTFIAGQNVTIQWTATNVDVAGPTKITLGYDADATPFERNQHWLEVDGVTAANGVASYTWNTTGVASGTYYLSGYMYDFSTGQAVFSHLATSIVITGGAPPVFTLTGPTAATFAPGTSVTIGWTATNVDVAGPAKITLGYDADATAFDANEQWIEIDGVTAANGAGSYTWNTTGMAVGSYYLDGYMYDFSTDKAVYSHLGTSIVIT